MPMPSKQTPATKRAPQQQRAIERIDAIFAATEEVLSEDGYDGLTMVKIAARADITHTSIYHYFASVEAILATLISRLMADFDAQMAANLARADSPQALIDVLLESLHQGFQMYRSTPVARGLWTATRFLPTMRKIDDEDTARNVQHISERFQQLSPDGDHEAFQLSVLMAGSLTVHAYEVALTLPESSQDRALQEFLEMARARLEQAFMSPE